MSADIAAALASALHQSTVRGIVSAYLFGSHATGRAHRESDLDIGVLLDRAIHRTRETRFEAGLRLARDLSRAAGPARLDLVVLDDAPPQLVRRIMMDGIRIVCSDMEADHAERRTALLRAADLEPFLRRTRAVKLRAIAR